MKKHAIKMHLVLALAIFAIAFASPITSACNVPVFRYALERWPVDAYEVYIFHKGPLDEAALKTVESLELKLDKYEFQSQPYFIETVDVDSEMPAHIKAHHDAAKPKQYPWLYVQYPKSQPKDSPVYSGEFKKEQLERLLDSPIRQEIANQILKGESVVWLLIKSGNKEKDEAALRMLQEELAALVRELKLPELTEDDDRYIDVDKGPGLKLSFKLLAISRDDPKEQQLIRILENWDRSIIDTSEPIAFPFFGRGRVLPALTGKDLNPQSLFDACSYLIGPCGCQIKRDNPGYDVLTTVNWDGVITGQYTLAEALPRLTTVSASAVIPLKDAIAIPPSTTTAPSIQSPATSGETAGASPLRSMLLTLVFGIVAVVVVTIFMQSRRQEN